MKFFLIPAFLFFIGSLAGWCIEVLFRRFFSAKKWINPGFLTGPYLPLYGFSLCILYCMASMEIAIPIETLWLKRLVLFVLMSLCITLVEYAAGLIFIKRMKIKLWDYSDRRGNINGIICPLFSFFGRSSARYTISAYTRIFSALLTGFRKILRFLSLSDFHKSCHKDTRILGRKRHSYEV